MRLPPPKRRKPNKPPNIKPVETISFDPTAREDYLTGFRKRKQQRIKHARGEAEKKERALKIESRKQIRDQRQRDLEAHVKAVDDMLKKSRDEDSDQAEEDEDTVGKEDPDGQAGEEGAEPAVEDAGHEDEYIDEDKYTTVTVEPMDGSEAESSEDESVDSDAEAKEDDKKTSRPTTRDVVLPDGTIKKKRIWTKEKPSTSKVKKKAKPKKFRYESKVERRATKAKQSARNNEAAKARRSGGRS